MRNGILGVTLALLAGIGVTFTARASDHPDWKYYGYSGSDYLVFDAAGVKRKPDRHVEVWTKHLPQKDFERTLATAKPGEFTDVQKGMLDAVASRRKKGERLALEAVAPEGINEQLRAVLMTVEEVANRQLVEPHLKVLFEIDCGEDQFRVLSGFEYGKSGTKSVGSGPWEHTPPESIGANLRSLVCAER